MTSDLSVSIWQEAGVHIRVLAKFLLLGALGSPVLRLPLLLPFAAVALLSFAAAPCGVPSRRRRLAGSG